MGESINLINNFKGSESYFEFAIQYYLNEQNS